jgi:hypothetical protein
MEKRSMAFWRVYGITQTWMDGSRSVSVTVHDVPYTSSDEAAFTPSDHGYSGLSDRSGAIETHAFAVEAESLPEAAKLAIAVFLEGMTSPHVRHIWTTVAKPSQSAGRERG